MGWRRARIIFCSSFVNPFLDGPGQRANRREASHWAHSTQQDSSPGMGSPDKDKVVQSPSRASRWLRCWGRADSAVFVSRAPSSRGFGPDCLAAKESSDRNHHQSYVNRRRPFRTASEVQVAVWKILDSEIRLFAVRAYARRNFICHSEIYDLDTPKNTQACQDVGRGCRWIYMTMRQSAFGLQRSTLH